MESPTQQPTAVIAGIGDGLGRQLALTLADAGYRVAGLARSDAVGKQLVEELGTERYRSVICDVSDEPQISAAIDDISSVFGAPSVYVHNASGFLHRAFLNTTTEEFEALWRTACLGAMLGAQRVLPAMLRAGSGVLLFVGATASVKPGASFSAFGAAKFALRGLAHSLAREFGSQGIHVAHLIVDGVIWGERARDVFGMQAKQCLDPHAIARTCLALIEQDRSAWTLELDIRPDVERY